jgi:tRNA threonylcarbamoyladenosine biosynthesis protein TsaB
MSKILCIETSTEVCSVCLLENGKLIDIREDLNGLNHSKLLTVFIQDILESNNLKAIDLDAVAVGEGPGSYTGLRIGVSAAKGLCFGALLPLIAVSPLDAMVSSVADRSKELNLTENDILVPMIDARRMEVYSAKYDRNGERIAEVTPVVVDENSFSTELEAFRIFFFGNGAAKCKPVLTHKNAVFIDDVITSSQNMAKIAEEKFINKDFVDLAYFEPFYLKSFIATTSKKNILLG